MGVLGQTRDRTNFFFECRNSRKSGSGVGLSTKKGYSRVEKQSLVKESGDLEEGPKSNLTVAPPWVRISDEIHLEIQRIEDKMKMLVEAHSSHLLPKIDDSVNDEEQTIEVLSGEIAGLFKVSKAKISKMKNFKVEEQEEPMRDNMVSSLASSLQDLSVSFRKAQKDYLHRLRARQQRGKAAFIIEEDEFADDSKFEVNFTQAQTGRVVASEEMIAQREREIKEIAKSITELASIFNDLSTLVIEQGTVLDRIDYNLELVEHNTKEAVGQLEEAKKIQGSYRNKLCMLLLCIGVFVMILVVMVKGFAF